MTGKTHTIGALAASLATSQFTNYDPVLLVGAGVVGGLIPDICHGGSKIGRTLPFISRIVNILFGHRSFTHSLLFMFIVGSLLHTYEQNAAVTVGLLVGMMSHYILDMSTKKGIQLFFPLTIRVRFPLTTRTGGKVEELILAALSLISVYFGYEAFGFSF